MVDPTKAHFELFMEMCLLHLTQPSCIREVRGAALIHIHIIAAQGAFVVGG